MTINQACEIYRRLHVAVHNGQEKRVCAWDKPAKLEEAAYFVRHASGYGVDTPTRMEAAEVLNLLAYESAVALSGAEDHRERS